MDRCFYRPMEAQGVVGGGERWDTEPRVGRVGLLAVAVRGVGGARRADWDVGMFRWAGRGGPLAQRCPGKTAGAARDRSVVELVGQGLVEHEGTDAKRWSVMSSTSVGSKDGVWSSRKSP